MYSRPSVGNREERACAFAHALLFIPNRRAGVPVYNGTKLRLRDKEQRSMLQLILPLTAADRLVSSAHVRKDGAANANYVTEKSPIVSP